MPIESSYFLQGFFLINQRDRVSIISKKKSPCIRIAQETDGTVE